jgi:hypothetical protein
MNVPTQSQVNAASRHAATFTAGAIAMFGLSTKLDPNTVQQIITASGNLINDIILLAGLITPIVTSLYASWSATPASQSAALEKDGAIIVTTPAIAAATPNSPNVMSSADVKVVPR